MESAFYSKLEAKLSPARMAVYNADGRGPCIALARYLLNAALSEALYSPLQLCEVALRNSIHTELTRLLGRTDWYDDPGFPMTVWGGNEILKAKGKLTKHGKRVIPDSVVAELTFGFWPSLFEDHYERHTAFMPGGIRKVFPHLQKSKHNRKALKAELEKIRDLRNRIFHHERIVHLRDLNAKHQLILDVISWVSPELRKMADVFDRFTPVRSAGLTPWITKIRAQWPAPPPPASGP
jgi:hypothetical protein